MAKAKQEVEILVEQELENSEDNKKVEDGVVKFIEWIRDKKLQIRAYSSQKIHTLGI